MIDITRLRFFPQQQPKSWSRDSKATGQKKKKNRRQNSDARKFQYKVAVFFHMKLKTFL